MTNSNIQIRVFTTFTGASRGWKSLESQADCFAFQTFDWLNSVYETMEDPEEFLPYIVLVEFNQQPLMLLPMCIEHNRSATRLTWFGGKLTDYQGPVLHKRFADRVDKTLFLDIWRRITATLPPVDVIDLQKQPRYIGNELNPFIYLPHWPHSCSAHFTKLKGTTDEFISARRSKKWISTQNRKLRRLKELGEVNFREISTIEELQTFIPIMLRQKSESYRNMGAPDLFAQKSHEKFVRTILTTHLADDFSTLFVLIVGNTVIASHWGLSYRGRFYSLIHTYNSSYAKFSPGTILFCNLFQWCKKHGLRVFDFTIGDESYKSLWCEGELQLFDHMKPTSLRGSAYAFVMRRALALKRKIKQTPQIHKLLLKARKVTDNLARGLRRRDFA